MDVSSDSTTAPTIDPTDAGTPPTAASDLSPLAPDLVPRLDLVVLDCPDALGLGRFYSDLLGWPMEDDASVNWVTLVPPGGGAGPDDRDGRATLAFQRIDDYVAPTWPGGAHPQQFHLDFSVRDIVAAEPRVLALGATVHEHQPSTDGGFRVYLDPAGHPFCLVR